MTHDEADELQEVIFDAGGDCPGATSFALADGYEVHPRPPGQEFPATVRDWLKDHGFTRHVDVKRGPFWRREAGGAA